MAELGGEGTSGNKRVLEFPAKPVECVDGDAGVFGRVLDVSGFYVEHELEEADVSESGQELGNLSRVRVSREATEKNHARRPGKVRLGVNDMKPFRSKFCSAPEFSLEIWAQILE